MVNQTSIFPEKHLVQYEHEKDSYKLSDDGSFSGIINNKWVYLSPNEVCPKRVFDIDKRTKNDGYMSLKDYQNRFLNDENADFTDEEIEQILDSFYEWSKRKYYGMFYNIETKITHFREFAKRGNSKYRRVLMAKILTHFDFMKSEEFEKKFLVRKTRNGFYTNTLFFTLTNDPKFYFNNRKKAWMSESKYLNLFLTNLRKNYGNIEYIAVPESTKKGYPHHHLLIIFEKPQKIFFHEKSYSYRLEKKKDLEKYWHSLIDVVAPETSSDVINYLFKDMFKGVTRQGKNRTHQDNLTMALHWIFRKQSYSNSKFSKKGFLGSYIANFDLIKESIIQTAIREDIDTFSDGKHIFLGITSLKFKNGYDPPDNFSVKLNQFEIDKYCLVRFDKKLEKKISVLPSQKTGKKIQ